MPERICPNCGERLTVSSTAVPLGIRCPACEGSFTQRPDLKPRRESPADDDTRADRPDAGGPAAPRGVRLSASWRDFRPSPWFLLTLAVIAVGVIASQVVFRAWRANRPGLMAEVAAPAGVALPPEDGDVLTLSEAGTQLSPQQSQALRAAREAMAGGDYGLARDILGAMSARADRKPAVWIARGDVHSYQGDFAAAADAYERAVDLQSESAWLYRQLGEAHRRLKHPVRAIDAFRRAIALDDGDAGSHFGLGDVYLSRGLHAAAIAELTAAIGLDDSRELYHYTLGSAYYADKQYTQAGQAFRDALQLAPDQPMNAYALGNCHYALGQYARAKDAYQMAVNLAPDEPLYHYVLGNACYRLGEIDRAILAYERYIDLEPGTTRSDQARDLVDKLRSRSDEP